MSRKVLIDNFWPPYLGDGDPRLYDDECGWRDFHRTDAKSNETRRVFDFYVEYYAFNLIIYIVEMDEFLYIDTINGIVFVLQPREDWDGRFIFERCEFTDNPDYDIEPIFEFESALQLWENFKYRDNDLKYLIEHSVIDTQH